MPVTISATDFQRRVGFYTDKAMQEPVIIASHGRDRLVLLSVEDYNRLKMLDEREVVRCEEIPEGLIQELEGAVEEAKISGVVKTSYTVTHF